MQSGLEKRDLSALQRVEFARVPINARDVVAEIGKTGSGYKTYITGSDHCYSHAPIRFPKASKRMPEDTIPGDTETR